MVDETFYNDASGSLNATNLGGYTITWNEEGSDPAAPCEECPAVLSITSIQALSNDTVRITFSESVVNSAPLLEPDNYIFTPSLTVLSVSPGAITDPTYVDLTVSGLTSQIYSVDILTIEPSSEP